MNMVHKRESGENPERCRHCVRELLQSPLGNREGEAALTEVRRTALAWNLRSAVHRTCILITIHEYFLNVFWKKRVHMGMVTVAENAAVFYAVRARDYACMRPWRLPRDFLYVILSGNTRKKRKKK